VTVAVILLVYAAGVGTAGSRLLGRARWAVRAPLLGIVIYLAAAWSVLAALGLAGLTLAVHATALGGGLGHLIGACVLRLRDAYATPGGATVAGLGLTLAGAVLARIALTATTHLRAVRRQAVQHAQTARLVGRPDPDLGVTLVDHAQPAAYCVAGPHPTVILTTATLQALDPEQLGAVLAHERAHQASHHHHLLLAAARIGRQVGVAAGDVLVPVHLCGHRGGLMADVSGRCAGRAAAGSHAVPAGRPDASRYGRHRMATLP
jgi:Zn-dependent protease with chaperone function